MAVTAHGVVWSHPQPQTELQAVAPISLEVAKLEVKPHRDAVPCVVIHIKRGGSELGYLRLEPAEARQLATELTALADTFQPYQDADASGSPSGPP